MSEVAETHEFDREEFERALALLDREREAMQLSRGQRISYRLYSVFAWGIAISVIGMLAAAIYRAEANPAAADKLLTGFMIAIFIFLLGGVVSLFLNLPLIIKRIRQRRLLRRMGISVTSEAMWKARGQSQRWGRATAWTALGLGILCVALALGFFGVKEAVAGWIVLPVGLLLGMFYVLRNAKEWLDMMSARGVEVEQLKDSLMRMVSTAKDGVAERIAVSSEAIKQFSRIESEQIARSRVRAITESVTAPQAEFSILSSRDVLKVKASLEPEARLRVEEALDALTLRPRSASAVQDPGTGFLRQAVQGTSLELLYQVDDSARQLKAIALRPSEAGSVPGA